MRYLIAICLCLMFAGCGSIKSSHQVVVTPETLAIVKARPEFAGVDCKDDRLAVVGAEVSSGSLLLSVNCIKF